MATTTMAKRRVVMAGAKEVVVGVIVRCERQK
jgi:hypothetical protein